MRRKQRHFWAGERMECILSIDQSTSVTKGLVWNAAGRLLGRADMPHRQITNELGWVEHDPEEIYANVLQAAAQALEKAGIRPAQVCAVGLSNQRETAVCWEATTGRPVCNAIVWQCARAADICTEIRAAGLAEPIQKKTGLNLSPFFTAAKFAWAVRNVPAARTALQAGTLRCGTMDTWLIYKLTGNFFTDYSNASRTQLLNLDTLAWDGELVRAFGLTQQCLPQVHMSDSCFGSSTFGGLFPAPVPICGVLGDSHAALFGNHCVLPGMAKITYGTGSSVMVNAGSARPARCEGAVTSLAWGMRGSVQYVLEGNINYAGAVIQWLTEDIELLDSPKDAGKIAALAQSTQGVYLIPAFSGLGAPHFNDRVRAAFVGMNRTTKRAHLVRAAEECIAYQVADVARAIQAGSTMGLQEICADGGPTRDAFLMQFQADMLGLPLKIRGIEELSGAGAAYCAALSAGVSCEERLFKSAVYQVVPPRMAAAERETLYAGWKSAVRALAAEEQR